MKKSNYIRLTIISVLLLTTNYANSQIGCSNNNYTSCSSSDYVGWAGTESIPLRVKTNAAYPIEFYTNGTQYMTLLGSTNPGYLGIGTATPTAIIGLGGNTARTIQMERHTTSNTAGNDLTILGGGATSGATNKGGGDLYLYSGVATGSGASKILLYTSTASSGGGSTSDNTQTSKVAVMGSGYVGIGTSFTGPNSRLTVKEGSNNDAWFQICGNNTGSASSNGLRIGVLNPAGGPYDVEIRQQENAPIKFFTNDGSSVAERMRITAAGYVGIGTTTPSAKVDVIGTYSATSALNVVYGATLTNSGNTSNNIGNYVIVNSSGTGCHSYGVWGEVNNTGTGSTYGWGGTFSSNGSTNNFGYQGSATGGENATGVYAVGQNGTNNNYGVNSIAYGNSTSSNYIHGVHAEVYSSGGTYSQLYGVYASGGTCTSSSCVNAAGYFSGDILYNAAWSTSDLFLKDSIQPVNNPGSIIDQLNPVTYTFKTQQYPSMHLNVSNNFGLISEEVELILPELVRSFSEPEVKDSLGNIIYPQINFKAINYQQLIPLLIAEVKEMRQAIIALQAGQKSNNNINSTQQKTGSIEVELSNQNKIILDQNDPNPFAENTTINYFIPENVTKVQMMFYDNSGTILKTVDIKEKGAGSITVYGSNLSSGTYSYTLLADGKVIETKKMMKVK